MEDLLKAKVQFIDGLVDRMSKGKEATLVDVLREEIGKLKRLNAEYEALLRRKTICSREESSSKIKYSLNDGSVYMVSKTKNYKYLYDSATGIITYEFPNGQIERTFPHGIKEIRAPSGKIVIKSSAKEYDVIEQGRK